MADRSTLREALAVDRIRPAAGAGPMRIPVLAVLGAIALCLASACAHRVLIPQHPATSPLERTDPYGVARTNEVQEQTRQQTPSLVFLGDSITEGWRWAGPDVWDRYYAERRPLNLGVAGDRTEHVLWRIEQPDFGSIRPQLIVLMIGTNNTGLHAPAQIADGIRAIVRELRARQPQAQVLLLAIFPRSGAPGDALRTKVEAVNRWLPAVAREEGARYLDIGDAFLEEDGTLSREVMPDFLHLSHEGYERWARAIEPAIEELMGGSAERESLYRDGSRVRAPLAGFASPRDGGSPCAIGWGSGVACGIPPAVTARHAG